MEPWICYTTPASTTWSLSAQSTHDWNGDQWTVPMLASASRLVTLGDQSIQFGLSPNYDVEKASGGPDGGLDFSVTLSLPETNRRNQRMLNYEATLGAKAVQAQREVQQKPSTNELPMHKLNPVSGCGRSSSSRSSNRTTALAEQA
jgi:hypothetical protein